MKLTINREARLEDPSDDGQTTPPDASHPFFWAGYMVVE